MNKPVFETIVVLMAIAFIVGTVFGIVLTLLMVTL